MPWLTQDALEFLAELELNNNKDWFEANKKRYEKSVKEPVRALAGELIERMKVLDPRINMEPKDAVFRIHRDTRFSKGKEPYKTNVGMVVNAGGKHSPGNPGVYVHLDPRQFAIAGGHYFLEPEQLTAVRRHIVANGKDFRRLLDEEPFEDSFGQLTGQVNKVLPAEFKEAAKSEPLLFNKQFFFWAEHPAEEALRDDLPDFVMKHVKAGWPLSTFLSKALS